MNNLKILRENAGLSQGKLSELSGISVRTIQHYEQGSRDINKAQGITLLTLANFLNCTIEDLLEK